MGRIAPLDIKNLGFVAEMFGQRPDDFDAWLEDLIAEQADILEGRIGLARYATVEKPVGPLVQRAEKALAAAELYQRRFNRIASDIKGADGMDAFKLRRTRNEYQAEAEALIARILADAPADSGDYAGGVVETAHDTLEEA